MRQNPYGARTLPNPRGERIAMADDDPRQRGRFAAAWTAGYAAAIAPAEVAVWVPAAFTGPRGLLDAGGALLPVGEMVRDLARLAGAEVLAAGPFLPRRFAVLAVRSGRGTVAMLANLTPEVLGCELEGARTLGPFEVQRIEPRYDASAIRQVAGQDRPGMADTFSARPQDGERRQDRPAQAVGPGARADAGADPRRARSGRATRCRPSTS